MLLRGNYYSNDICKILLFVSGPPGGIVYRPKDTKKLNSVDYKKTVRDDWLNLPAIRNVFQVC